MGIKEMRGGEMNVNKSNAKRCSGFTSKPRNKEVFGHPFIRGGQRFQT